MSQRINFSDEALLAALRSDEELDEGIRRLYSEYYGIVRAYVEKNSGQQADSEDVFQEVVVTFIDLVRQGRFRAESSISTFLYSLARHIWLNQLKKRGRDHAREELYEKGAEDDGKYVAQIMANRESMLLLMDAVHRLGEVCKKILVGFYFEKRSIREILAMLNYENEQVVRNKKQKCLRQLEEWISERPWLSENLRSILTYE